jgi:hypothetical protein
MAAPTLQEILIGGFAFFVENGKTVDAQTVGPTIKPDVVPTSNWLDRTLGHILEFEQGVEESDQSYMRLNVAGGFSKQNRKFVTEDFIILKTRHMSEPVWRLQQGFAAEIAEGTAQTPGGALERSITGWLRIQGRQLGGYDRFIQDWWCEMRLAEAPKFSPSVTAPSLRFSLIPGPTGNSSNFPALA